MGFTTCARHRVRCCWGCDRCPKEDGFRLGRGDYCPACSADYKRRGFPWCAFCRNYHFDGRPVHDPAGRIIEPAPELDLKGAAGALLNDKEQIG